MAGPGAGIPAEAMARFVSAEARIYPMALTDVAGYSSAMRLVGLLAEELRTSTRIEAVLQRRADLLGRLPSLAAAASLSVDGLPAEALVDAASALRCRELQAGAGAGDP